MTEKVDEGPGWESWRLGPGEQYRSKTGSPGAPMNTTDEARVFYVNVPVEMQQARRRARADIVKRMPRPKSPLSKPPMFGRCTYCNISRRGCNEMFDSTCCSKCRHPALDLPRDMSSVVAQFNAIGQGIAKTAESVRAPLEDFGNVMAKVHEEMRRAMDQTYDQAVISGGASKIGDAKVPPSRKKSSRSKRRSGRA